MHMTLLELSQEIWEVGLPGVRLVKSQIGSMDIILEYLLFMSGYFYGAQPTLHLPAQSWQKEILEQGVKNVHSEQ